MVGLDRGSCSRRKSETLTGPFHAHDPRARPWVAVKEGCQLFGHRTGQLFDICNCHRAVIVARHIVTDANGNYLFTNVDASQVYFVQFVAIPGLPFTLPDVGDDTTDSDADPAIVAT